MRIAYFDCFSGVSGDMILGALIDAGADLQRLELELGKLKISGFTLKAEKTTRRGLSGTKFFVDQDQNHAKRHLTDIEKIVDNSDLLDDIKPRAKSIFRELAAVEAKIHNTSPADVHFHEIGALDSIVDVVGSLIAMKMLGIETIYASRIPVGTGFVECDHGVLPLPAPATLELIKGIPVYASSIEKELVTPTGIAILKHVVKRFGTIPDMRIEHIGYGAGSRDLKIPNLLRVWIGESDVKQEYEEDAIILIETNIDNMNPEIIGYAMERILERGALDVFMTPIFMKKNRPGTLLSVLITPGKLDETISVIFSETSSLGIRFQRLERRKLPRELITVETSFGPVRVKVSHIDTEKSIMSPEYEDCREIAARMGIPLRTVYEEAQTAAERISGKS
ncbi:MAG: nickel pincer cofactor biosynthesis protein LarC [Syntrophales bacterium]